MVRQNSEVIPSRRSMMVGTAASLLAASSMNASAQTKGPAVWLGLDQRELDDAYDQIKYAPNLPQITGRYRTNSVITRARIGAPKRLKYGTPDIEGADLFPAKAQNAPVQIFIHGGAWRGGMADAYSFPAEMFTAAGAHYIAIDFSNVGETKGDLLPMADQCRRAVAWIAKNAASFGGDPNRIYLSGHSSGAHLGGVVVVTDWEKDFGLPKDVLKGAVLCSGMYDLKPVRLSARSNYVTFTDEMEQRLSAQRHLALLNTPVVVAHGSLETPEFQRQSRDFVEAVKQAGKPAELLVGEGYNHFEIMETLASPYGVLGRAALAQMKLAVG
ncbi:MAG: alpha/beta hydrolase [Pseudorhodoplanes sp.]